MANKFGEGSWYFNNARIGGIKVNRTPNQQEIGSAAPNIGGYYEDAGFASADADIRGQDNEYRAAAELQERHDERVASGARRYIPDFFIDGTDALANKGFLISFQSTITGKNTHFKAFITAFNETYTSNWNQEEVYGRADPIYMFKNTVRNITLSFKVPASTEGEAYENLMRVQSLIQNLYPAYTNVQNAQTISQSPLVRMKVVNMTPSIDSRGDAGFRELSTAIDWGRPSPGLSPDTSTGLLGVIKNVTVTHNLENGDVGVFELGAGLILPKLIEVNLDFGVIHESPLAQDPGMTSEEFGFIQTNFTTPGFPYGATRTTEGAPMTKEQIKEDYSNNIADYTARLQAENEAIYSRETAEQAMANADARYVGMFGKARFNRDQRRLNRGAIKNDEKRAYIAQTVSGQNLKNDYAAELADPIDAGDPQPPADIWESEAYFDWAGD